MPRFLDHHLNAPHLKIKLDNSKDIKLLYGVRFVKSMGSKLVWFFFPFFLYEMANSIDIPLFRSLTDIQRGMLLIAFFYGFQRFAVMVTTMPLARLSAKVGTSRSFIFAQLLAIIIYIILQYSSEYYWLIIVIAIIDGMETNMFWNNYQPLLDENAKKNNLGKDLGIVQFMINFSMMISPAIGGVIINYFGFQGLFMAGIIVTLFGIMMSLSFSTSHSHRDIPSWSEFFKWTKEKAFKRLAISFSGKYFHEAVAMLWPLYVLFLVGSIEKVGFLYTFSLFLAMIVSFFVGSRIDKSHSKKPFFMSGSFISLIWIMRMQVVSIWNIAIVDTLNSLTGNYHWLFFDRKLMVRGKGKKVFSYFTYHEIIISLAAMIFWSLVAAIFLIFPVGWNGLFVIAAIGVMLSLLIKEHKV